MLEDILSDSEITRDGYIYNSQSDHWIIMTPHHGRLRFHFDMPMHREMRVNVKRLFVSLLRTRNPRSAQTVYKQIRTFLNQVGSYDVEATSIQPHHILNYRTSLSSRHLYRSDDVNAAIILWSRLAVPGVHQKTVAVATQMPRGARNQNFALKLRDHDKGAYSNIEFDGLYKALLAKFAQGELSLYSYALCLLSAALAPRPIQLAGLWLSDLNIEEENGVKSYTISVPRAKQRGGHYRKEFTHRPLIAEIGMVIEAHAEAVRKAAVDAGIVNLDEVHLFSVNHVSSAFYIDGSSPLPPTPTSIASRISMTMEDLQVRSERTGKVINANATRARRTLGTRAAQEGKSLEHIAHLLDHSSTTSAKHYIELTSELLQNLNEKLAFHLAPLAQRFLGTIIDRTSGPPGGIQRHVFGQGNVEGPTDLGGCGKFGFCGLGKPTACYTCRLFNPWIDAPHEAVLSGLLEKRANMEAHGSTVVAQSLDDTILACAEVVRLCLLRKKEITR